MFMMITTTNWSASKDAAHIDVKADCVVSLLTSIDLLNFSLRDVKKMSTEDEVDVRITQRKLSSKGPGRDQTNRT